MRLLQTALSRSLDEAPFSLPLSKHHVHLLTSQARRQQVFAQPPPTAQS